MDSYDRLQSEVIQQGLCTHCGTCVGLSGGRLKFTDTDIGPLPARTDPSRPFQCDIAVDSCPGGGVHYPSLNRFVFGRLPSDWLVGNVRRAFIGYAADQHVRRNGASGGIISASLLYLLKTKQIDGAVVLRQGLPEPWLASPIIARTPENVMQASQSVYVPSPMNIVLAELEHAEGRYAFVGLPDQVASIRKLQQANHPAALKIKYIFGLYCGTMMYIGAIRSFLRSNGVQDISDIAFLRYREGEWPGKLRIVTKSGAEISAGKFHYNYLIPFFITQSSLLSVDFTNELADISAGDAWHPKYEKEKTGYSAVLARSSKGEGLLNEMIQSGIVYLEEQPIEFVQSMHGHMLDFKKRGAFLRMELRRKLKKRVPDFGYRPARIAFPRRVAEVVIVFLFSLGRTRFARTIVERIPLSVIGPLFDGLRKSWKNISKPVKRRDLSSYRVLITEHDRT